MQPKPTSIWFTTPQAAQAVNTPVHDLRNQYLRHGGWRKSPLYPRVEPRKASNGHLYWKAADLYRSAGMLPAGCGRDVQRLATYLHRKGVDLLHAYQAATALLAQSLTEPLPLDPDEANQASHIAQGATTDHLQALLPIVTALASVVRETASATEGYGDSQFPLWLARLAQDLSHELEGLRRPMAWATPPAPALPTGDMFTADRGVKVREAHP